MGSNTNTCEKKSEDINCEKKCDSSSSRDFYTTLRTVLTVVAIIALVFTIIYLITKIYSNVKMASFLKNLECEIKQVSASASYFFQNLDMKLQNTKNKINLIEQILS
jgi:hypothetical protein